MSYFICLSCSAPKKMATELFLPPLELWSITGTSAGNAVAGNGYGRESFVVVVHGCSTDIMNYHRNCNRRYLDLFKRGIRDVCLSSMSVAILLHFFRTDINVESINVQQKMKIMLPDFLKNFPDIQEDTRYLLIE